MKATVEKKKDNSQKKQIMLWIGALVVGAVLGMLGLSALNDLMNFIATVYTRLFQLLAVPTIALAVTTTLAALGNQADTGRIFKHTIVKSYYHSISINIVITKLSRCVTHCSCQIVYCRFITDF